MVIQRIQTVFLLIAAVLLAVFPFLPAWCMPGCETGACYPKGDIIMLIVCLADALLTAITIFRYHDLKRQISLSGVCALLSVAAIVLAMLNVLVLNQGNATGDHFALLLPVVALVLQLLARRAIKADKRLLADSERIR